MPDNHATPDTNWAHQWSLRVYYEDTDAGGVVFYANYLKFMERARTEWLRSLGVSQRELSVDSGLVFVVSALSIDYKSPARLDDLLTVRSSMTQVKRASINFYQQIVFNDKVLASSQVRVGCVNVHSLKPAAMPNELYQHISLTSQR